MEIQKGWGPFSFKGSSQTGVLVLQGFTGSTSSVYPLGKYLADKGCHVEIPRLTGHGTRWQDLNKVSFRDWIRDVEDGLALLKKRASKIFVAGLSMGGALTLYLAEKHPELKGIILVNHMLLLHNPALYITPVLRYIIQSVDGISNDIKDTNQQEICYDRTPMGGLHELTKLLWTVQKDLRKVIQPCLIFKSRNDHVLPVKNALYTYQKLLSQEKELVWLENSYHVATMDNDKELIFKKTLEFINRCSK
ncbi:MAG: alpha/beta fold hydrolase [bacterium]|nr:alpha/beta fold hydrolase [bacterium]